MIADEFWCHVKKTKGCWLWTAGKSKGYGVFKLRGKIVKAYRHSWELANGPIPKGRWICHHCDNPPCVRPDHLFLGDNKANMRDMWNKGRHPPISGPGELAPSSKLTNSDVRTIKEMLKNGVKQSRIAATFNVDPSNISQINRGYSWRHI